MNPHISRRQGKGESPEQPQKGILKNSQTTTELFKLGCRKGGH